MEKEFLDIKKKAFENFVRLDKLENLILDSLNNDVLTVLKDE